METKQKNTLLWVVTVVALGVLFGVTTWLHYMQLCVVNTSDLKWHLLEVQAGSFYVFTYVLIWISYHLGGYVGMALMLSLLRIGTIVLFAVALRPALRGVSWPKCLLLSLAANLTQAVWIPHGGDGYVGTITSTIYHNTTYIGLAPFALLAMLYFYRAWQGIHHKIDVFSWCAYTVFLTIATSCKASFVFAFAPALLILLVADLVKTRGKNLLREVVMGCSVLPSIALCLIQSMLLFGDGTNQIALIFSVDFDPEQMAWGFFNPTMTISFLRSFVFVGAVGILLYRMAWASFQYRFSLLLFGVALAEALLLVEDGPRLYDANLWWGTFICFLILLLESVSIWAQAWLSCRQGTAARGQRWRVTVCGVAFLWHVVTGVGYLALQCQSHVQAMQMLAGGA